MSRRCTVCDHPEREALDRALALDTAGFRRIAKRFGLGEASLFRHAVRHLPATLVQSLDIERACRAESLALDLLALRDRVAMAIDRADGSDAALLRAVAEARKINETLARVA